MLVKRLPEQLEIAARRVVGHVFGDAGCQEKSRQQYGEYFWKMFHTKVYK